MESRAKALGHPIHQMLIPFPFGLLSTAFIFDIVYLFVSDATTKNTLSVVSFWMIAAGIVGGLLAAPFGLIDYLAIPQGTRARSVGMLLPLVFPAAIPSAGFGGTHIMTRVCPESNSYRRAARPPSPRIPPSRPRGPAN